MEFEIKKRSVLYFQSKGIMVRGWRGAERKGGGMNTLEHRTSAIVSNRKPLTSIHLVYCTTSGKPRPFPQGKRTSQEKKKYFRWKREEKLTLNGDRKVIEHIEREDNKTGVIRSSQFLWFNNKIKKILFSCMSKGFSMRSAVGWISLHLVSQNPLNDLRLFWYKC